MHGLAVLETKQNPGVALHNVIFIRRGGESNQKGVEEASIVSTDPPYDLNFTKASGLCRTGWCSAESSAPPPAKRGNSARKRVL
jgi:hypothetical protein